MTAEYCHEKVPVTIAVAVSESGLVRVAVANTHWIQQEREHTKMLEEIRGDKQLWSLKYINTTVPYPISKEDQL